jgi:hypothetical protein
LTCIVGITDGRRVVLGADSAGVSGYSMTIRADEKVFHNGEFVIGFTTSFRFGQILRYAFLPPDIDTWDVRKYMATDFVNAARRAFQDGGHLQHTSKGDEECGTCLIGVRGQLFAMHDDFQICVPADGFLAVGCGDQAALGSLYSSVGKPIDDRVAEALMASERFSVGVRGPFHIRATDSWDARLSVACNQCYT